MLWGGLGGGRLRCNDDSMHVESMCRNVIEHTNYMSMQYIRQITEETTTILILCTKVLRVHVLELKTQIARDYSKKESPHHTAVD